MCFLYECAVSQRPHPYRGLYSGAMAAWWWLIGPRLCPRCWSRGLQSDGHRFAVDSWAHVYSLHGRWNCRIITVYKLYLKPAAHTSSPYERQAPPGEHTREEWDWNSRFVFMFDSLFRPRRWLTGNPGNFASVDSAGRWRHRIVVVYQSRFDRDSRQLTASMRHLTSL